MASRSGSQTKFPSAQAGEDATLQRIVRSVSRKCEGMLQRRHGLLSQQVKAKACGEGFRFAFRQRQQATPDALRDLRSSRMCSPSQNRQ